MSNRDHLLLVDDEPSLRDPLARYLEKQGYRVKSAANATEARTLLAAYSFDLVLADIMMPGEDGLSLTRFLVERGEPPVILLTARSEEPDRILGLEMGADDYVVKPFSPRELVARIKTVLRRVGSGQKVSSDSDGALGFAGWVLKEREQSLHDADGVLVPLSSGEFRLLHALATRPGQVLNRDQLLDLTQGREAGPLDRAIDNQISRLRKKIERDPRNPELIKTVWGGGYRLSVDVTRL